MARKDTTVWVPLTMKWITVFLALVSLDVSAQSIPLYGLFEQELVNSRNYENPFADVELTVSYTSPSGRRIDFFGFHDGDGKGGQEGDIWKIRFMPDEAGTWEYEYTWSDGSSGGSGSFNCTSENAKPGPWRIDQANPYWFTDSHGNHFLPVAMHAHANITPTDWQDAIHWAKSRGYNTLVTPVINAWQWGDDWTNPTPFVKASGDPHGAASGSEKVVDPSRYNLKMWKEWDELVMTAGDNGIYIGHFEGPSGKYGGRDGKYPPEALAFYPEMRDRFDTDRNKRFIKYFIARQGAFWNVAYWSLGSTEIYHYSVADEAEFQEYISYLSSVTPWNRLITAQDCEQWHDKERRWLSRSSIPDSRKLNTLQTGVSSSDYPHWGNDSPNNTHWQAARPNNELALDSHAGFPMLCTECLWEGQGRAEKPLRIIWGMLMAGGHTMWADWRGGNKAYSDNDTWDLVRQAWTEWFYGEQQDPSERKRGSIGRAWVPVIPLSEHVFRTSQLGVNTTGDEQLKIALDLLSTMDYWKMRPQNDLVSGSDEAYCLADPGRQYLVYAPQGGTVRITLTPGKYQSYWFDPRNGNAVEQPQIQGGRAVAIQAPGISDWVLVVTGQKVDL